MLGQKVENKTEKKWLWLILALGFLLRIGLAAVTEGYPYDLGCFFAWGLRMAEVGAGQFYAADYFCDYPPAYLLVLGGIGRVLNAFQIHYQDKLAQVILILIPAMADTAIAWVTYRIAAARWNPRLALRFAGFVAFCPVFIYDTAVWKQIDAVNALLLLLCFVLLSQKRWVSAAVMFGLALAVKPQALLLGPVLALCYLLPLVFAPSRAARGKALKQGVCATLAALAAVILCGVPFFGMADTIPMLLENYSTTTSSYPYASINAFNFMALCGGNWAAQDLPFTISLFGKSIALWFSWKTFGECAIVALTGVLIGLGVRGQKRGRFSPLLLAAFYMIGIFVFAHCMHERYLLLGVVLLVAAAAECANAKLLCLAGGFSLTALVNLAVVYSVVDTDDNFLVSAPTVIVMKLMGAVATVLFCMLAYETYQICSGVARPLFVCPEKTAQDAVHRPIVCASQPRWSRREMLFVAALTAAVAAVSFCYLGSTVAPENPLIATQNETTQTVTVEGEAQSLWIYTAVVNPEAQLLLRTAAGEESPIALAEGGLFQWREYLVSPSATYTLTVSNAQIMELAFKDATGKVLAVHVADGTPSALFDEQDKIPAQSNQLNGFYFDEIYHARTAYESLNGLPIYETTHPPLGKNLIAFGVWLFGMTAFGWRFSGALCGVLMVPVLYLFVRRLTRSAKIAGFAALLLSFDFMRFTQSRIATIDTYGTFFILLSATCMVWYCQTVLQKGVCKAVLPMACAGIAFGCGAASKWTGIYAGAGLAILYFGVLYQRYLQLRDTCALANIQGEQPPTKNTFARECGVAIVGGVVFFVCVPLVIYITSYWPYRGANPSFGLKEWWDCQEYMYWYHSSLEATHPFSSTWYTWLLDLRPVWYYQGGGLPQGTYASIAGFFNPILAWVGIVAWLRLCVRALKGKGSVMGSVVIILFLSQLLPWMLVTRCTFLYHYWPSFIFVLVAIALWVQDIAKESVRRATLVAGSILVMSAAFFLWFYPALSGLPVGAQWAQSLHLLSSFGFYIL